jgi:LSD1 subclass zinc finger protein
MLRFMEEINVRVGTFSNAVFSGLRGFLTMTLLELNQMFSADEQCRELLKRLRWPESVRCPRCQADAIKLATAKELYFCQSCVYQFSVLAGTIFNDSHLPLPIWFTAVHLLCEAKKGMSALQLKRTLWGLNKGSYKTAWYLCHRIRAAMKEVDRPMLDGTVEMDETYVGGVQRGAGSGWRKEKEIVIGIRQRGGELRFFHAEDAKSGTLAQYIKENVSTDVEVIVTDDHGAYPWAMDRSGVGRERHKTINHSSGHYVNGEVHTNTVESAFSLLKRGIIGSWHKLSAKHLLAYLDEMQFRFNRRNRSDLFIDTLRHMVTAPVLTFEKLTAKPSAQSESAVPF